MKREEVKLLGLNKILEELLLHTQAKENFPHTLFIGPRGSGKTTLCRFIGNLKKRKVIELNGPSLNSKSLTSLLLYIKSGDILFIDEIHRLHPKDEEILYQPMEAQELTIRSGAQVYTIKLPPFTLLGATTRPSLLSKPLLSRFRLQFQIPMYNLRVLARIIQNRYPNLTRRDALIIAQHTLVPREALNLAYRIIKLNKGVIEGLRFLGYIHGLSIYERQYLQYVKNNISCSLNSLSSRLQLDEDTVKLIEDRLLFLQLIEITKQGRQLTPKGLFKYQELQTVQ